MIHSQTPATRIAFFDANYDSSYGAQRSMLALAHALAPRHEVVVVTTGNGALYEEAARHGLHCVVLRASERINAFGGVLWDYPAAKKARTGVEVLIYHLRVGSWLARWRPTHVVANDVRSLLLCGPPVRLTGGRLLWHVRDDTRLGLLHPLSARLAHRIVTVSDGVRRVFTDAERTRFEGKMRTVYTGIELVPPHPSKAAAKEALGFRPDELLVATVGMLTPRKGHRDVLAIAPSLVEAAPTAPTFLFVGDAPEGYEGYRDELETTIRSMPPELASRFRLLGWRGDVPALLQASDLLLQPSRSEGLPRVLLEAALVGTPAISNAVSGAVEILDHGETGFVVPIGDVAALAEHARRLVADSGLRRHMGERARARVAERFSVERYVRSFEDLLGLPGEAA